MTHEEYKQQLTAWAGLTEKRLAALCDEYLPQQSELGQAARYSLLGGGKRVRAVLTLAACQLAGADAANALDYACALEMLHCYSLIHDDMPCMDNDDFRRGRPSCHKQFGEATALLAADALVTAAFEVLAHAKCSAESRIEAVQLLAKGGGDRGMLYGTPTKPVRSSLPPSSWAVPPRVCAPTRTPARRWCATLPSLAWFSRSSMTFWTSPLRRRSWASPWAATPTTTKPPLSRCTVYRAHTRKPSATMPQRWPRWMRLAPGQIFCA